MINPHQKADKIFYFDQTGSFKNEKENVF